MERTFEQEFARAVEKLGIYEKTEQNRIHRETVRDPEHAYQSVDVKRPDPWSHDTFLSL